MRLSSISVKIFVLISAALTGAVFSPNAVLAAPHGIGINVKTSDGTIFMITASGQRRPYTSAGAFLSYGYNSFGSVVEATAEDLVLPIGSFIPPQDGKIICSDRGADKGTCYLITLGKKAGFTSAAVFHGLGFQFSRATYGDVSFMDSAGLIGTANEAHRPGVLVNNAGTVSLVGPDGLLGIPTVSTFESWGYSFADVVPANSYDVVKAQIGVMNARTAGALSPLDTLSSSAPSNPLPGQNLSLSQIVAQWRPRTALLVCFINYSNGTEDIKVGSGYFLHLSDGPTIMTNEHVISFDPYLADYCAVRLPGDTVVYVDEPEMFADPDDAIDLAFLKIKNPTYTMQQLPGSGALCSSRASIGQRLVILGYPATGSLEDITATEGIVSGYDGVYYTTSAKIESGNSGGLAISLENNCYLGIPTATVAGNYESLGRILDLNRALP
jgi:hypothetical protein